jgi:hypothetical protein
LVALTRSVVLERRHHHELGHLGVGWKVVADSLAELAPEAAGEPV